MTPSPSLTTLLAARARLLLVVGAAIAAGAAMTLTAAAATGHSPLSPLAAHTSASESPESPEASESPDAPESPEASESPKPAKSPHAAKPSAQPAPGCPADVRNHGAYVSSVARDHSDAGAAHGARVSAAAHSDCGKKAKPAKPESKPKPKHS